MNDKSSRLPLFFLFLGLLFAAGILSPFVQAASEPAAAKAGLPILDITFRPIKPATGEVTHVEVAIVLPSKGRPSDLPFTLSAPTKYTNISGIADRIDNLIVSDAKGPIDLKRLEDESLYGGMVVMRKWGAVRKTSGDIRVSYRARVPEPEPRPGPPYDLRALSGGVSGAGCGFMILPDEPTKFKIRLHWDLGQLEPGSVALTSIGDGDAEAEGPAENVRQSFFIAGPVIRYPEKGDLKGFRAGCLGTPSFDAKKMMVWTAKTYEMLKSFFRDPSPEPFGFFLIAGEKHPGIGGTGLLNSFMLYVPDDPDFKGDPRATIAHEMIHHWVGGLEGAAGDNFWFSEGMTVRYTALLPYRAGLFTAREYLGDVNGTYARYMTNPLRNMPNDKITGLFWTDRNAQILPYDRGCLYFYQIDAQIRKASGGKRTFDDVILELFEQRKNGHPLTKEDVLAAVGKEIGRPAEPEFEAVVIRGETLNLDPDAFGPEFERAPKILRRFELGFDENILGTNEKKVTGVVNGSAAERAGVKDGDIILNSVPLTELRSDDALLLKLNIRRGEKDLTIEYAPRGEAIEGAVWIPRSTFKNVPSVTKHEGTFNGRKVEYTTEIEQTYVSDGSNGPSARLVSISYLGAGADRNPGRPVIFIFNGGPIVPSYFLHLAAFGPKRVAFPDDLAADPATFPLIDNASTVLDVADLVFFDPAGTGFSRVEEGTEPDAYFSVDADARQLAQFVAAWSTKHGRTASPKYLFGESYGTMRVAVAAQKIARLDPPVRLDGVFLMGQAINIIETVYRPQNIISYVASLPTCAALGWYHGRVDKKGRTFEKFLDEVRLFARTEYLTALFRGNELPEAEKSRLAKRLSGFTGLSAETYLAADLRISKPRFNAELLKDRNLVLGSYDGRYTGPAAKSGRSPDPSLAINKAVENGFRSYAAGELGINAADYITSPPLLDNALTTWNWGNASPFGDWPYGDSLKEVMAKDPDFRVIIGVGYHDTMTTVGASEYAIAQSGWPKDQVRLIHYEGGHMAYSIEKSLKALMADVRTFVTEKKSKEAAAASSPLMKLVLKPGPADSEKHVGYVDVEITLPAAGVPAGEPLFTLPYVVANIDSVAKTLTDFAAVDAAGALAMEVKDNAAGSVFGPSRGWIPARPVKGDVTVRYRAPVSASAPTRSGPPFGLAAEGAGFSGAGCAFLLVPAGSERFGLSLRWDFSAMGSGSIGSSSFGEGDAVLAEPGAAASLSSAFFMAGPLRRYPEKPTAEGFSAVWFPSAPFDPGSLMAWSEKLYASMRAFFRTESVKPYRVFLRHNPVNPNGGVGLMNSFVATYDEKSRPDMLRLLLAHEMYHTFAPSLQEEAFEDAGTQWFSEGQAILYQRLLPLRAGLIAPAEFLEDLNATAARYYTNALNNTPNDQIFARFWEDTRIRVLPYDRGSMYLAVVNDRIRKASGGKRSLDDVLLLLSGRTRQGLPNTPAVWVEALTKEYGSEAKAEYEAMLAGAEQLPASDAFGKGFRRTTAKLRRFELGFDPKVMNQNPRIIRGLIPDSAAAQAGIRDGDEIVKPVGLDSVQEDQKKMITLRIRREGTEFDATYLPRGETMDAWQWERVPGVADADVLR